MDIRIGKYIQYKIRTLSERRKELETLKLQRNKLRQDIIDESPAPPDGQPSGKGATSSPVESKVLRLEKIDKRIETLEKELSDFKSIEEKIRLMGREAYLVYKHTIVGEMNPEYVAMEIGICRRSLFYMKAGILKYIATELGEYLDE